MKKLFTNFYTNAQSLHRPVPTLTPWSSLVKRSHLVCKKQKDRLYCEAIFFIVFLKNQPSLLLNGEVIWQASDSFEIKISMITLII